MSGLSFHFIDSRSGTDAGLAAAILSDCLSRQGYSGDTRGTSVLVSRHDEDLEQVFVVLAEDCLTDAGLLARLEGRSALVVCSARPAQTLRHELGHINGGVTAVDAEGIASDEGADPIVALLGGAARAVGLIDPTVLGNSVWSAFDRSLPYAAHAAIRAFDRGYSQARHTQ